MPRPLVFGNGRLLVQLDDKGRIRDFFWPEVGIRNHVAGHYHHTGIFESGRFSWLESDEWSISQYYFPRPGEGVTEFTSEHWSLRIETSDSVGQDYFVRQIKLFNLSETSRQLEVFFSQDFRIAESEIGDTAMYVPDLDSMVHFKWSYYFSCTARSGRRGIHQRTVGLRGINGLEGTWRDAEDGHLLGKPIEQGAVDSTFSVLVDLPAGGWAPLTYLIKCGASLEALGRSELEDRPPDWPLTGLDALPQRIRSFAELSREILKTQIDKGGAILAANDSDIMQSNRANYSYVWPRDGALVAHVLDRAGEHELARAYHEYTAKLIRADQPFFLQKYNTDGTLGATWHPWVFGGASETPLQEDETALTLWSIWGHVQATNGHEWLRTRYHSFVRPMADFLASFVDTETGLPEPSYDLWEERRGVHTFTVATVIAGLRAAAEIAAGHDDPARKNYSDVADTMLQSMLDHLVDPAKGVFLRGLRSTSVTTFEPDNLPDASLLLVGTFAGLSPDHPAVMATTKWIEEELTVRSPIGGLARYPGDYYARTSDAYPGNPWIITTLWLAQEQIRAAKSRDDLAEPLRWLEWAVERGGSTGVLGEQFHPETGEVMTVSPLTWSHAEFIATCLDWAKKHQALLS